MCRFMLMEELTGTVTRLAILSRFLIIEGTDGQGKVKPGTYSIIGKLAEHVFYTGPDPKRFLLN